MRHEKTNDQFGQHVLVPSTDINRIGCHSSGSIRGALLASKLSFVGYFGLHKYNAPWGPSIQADHAADIHASFMPQAKAFIEGAAKGPEIGTMGVAPDLVQSSAGSDSPAGADPSAALGRDAGVASLLTWLLTHSREGMAAGAAAADEATADADTPENPSPVLQDRLHVDSNLELVVCKCRGLVKKMIDWAPLHGTNTFFVCFCFLCAKVFVLRLTTKAMVRCLGSRKEVPIPAWANTIQIFLSPDSARFLEAMLVVCCRRGKAFWSECCLISNFRT